MQHASAPAISVGYLVRAFDPRTLGVVRTGRVVKAGPRWATIDFGLHGRARVARIDVVEVEDTRPQ
jgi:hypothetical protein